MKLAVIYNLWDSIETLKYSLHSMRSAHVFVFIFQKVSNFGERYDPFQEIVKAVEETLPEDAIVVFKDYEPDLSLSGGMNETNKRNLGIQAAKKLNCTHFLLADADEVYADFPEMVDEYIKINRDGSVCPIYTYFKLPTLRFESPDSYFVPFVHRLKPGTVAGHSSYPYYVDPTRRINCQNVALMSAPMHHFSYVRRDIVRKCRNSSARVNIEKSTILTDYAQAIPGYYVRDFFNQRLIEVHNQFGIEI